MTLNEAKQNIGKYVLVVNDHDWKLEDKETKILGMAGRFVVVERISGYPIMLDDGKIAAFGWQLYPEDIDLIAIPLFDKIKPYPHKCKKCKSAARICGEITLCSNIKCNKLKFKYKEVSVGSKNPIRCVCGNTLCYSHNSITGAISGICNSCWKSQRFREGSVQVIDGKLYDIRRD